MLARILLFLVALCSFAADNFYLKPGDRVVFYGDSITDQRLYTTFTESFVVTRFPKLDVTFVHSGWGGDRVTGGGGGPIDVRLQRDVFAYKPTVVTIMLGMNDGRYRAFDPEIFKTFSSGYESMVQSMKRSLPGVRITAIQPSPYDDVTRAPMFEGGYNAVLVRYGNYLKELAAREKLDVADLNTNVVRALQKANIAEAGNAVKIVPDRVHPGAAGHLLMAAELLKAWNAPAIVSAVEIDAAARSVTRSSKTKVDEISKDGAIAWTQTDEALPMPLDLKDPILRLALASSDFESALDRQALKVTGLQPALYSLRIDGEEAGNFHSEQLAEGVNLAMLPTPMLKQAIKVHGLTLKHTGIHNSRWRQLQVPLADDKPTTLKAAMDGLDALDAELIAQQRAAAQPVAHRFELATK